MEATQSAPPHNRSARFYNTYPCIIITAKGQPDVATRCAHGCGTRCFDVHSSGGNCAVISLPALTRYAQPTALPFPLHACILPPATHSSTRPPASSCNRDAACSCAA